MTSPPKDVTVHGYGGKHLELTVPDLPVKGRGDDRRFTGCMEGNLQSWIGEPWFGAYYGYTGPGYTEEFWILDVEGTRLMIAAGRSPDSAPEDLAEQRAVLDYASYGRKRNQAIRNRPSPRSSRISLQELAKCCGVGQLSR